MRKTLFTAVLCTLLLVVGSFAAPTTRYWDACKPSCGWTSNASGSPNGVCTSCDINGNKLSNADAVNACQNGPAFTCMGQAPWAVDDNLSYGFAAAHSNGDCGKCYELTFTSNGEGGTSGGSISGKKMIIMVSNIGDIRAGAAFDLMIPGGGVGDFDALTRQISQNGGSSANMGAQYGGFRAAYDGGCGNDAACIRQRCDAAFGSSGLSDLKAGCYWFIDWFKIANNPTADHKEVTCPAVLVTAYREGKGGGGPPVQPNQTYTLTMSVNPTGGGTTNPASSQSNISSGTPVNISATPANGYTFSNWTVTSGSATFASANSATTTVTLTANATIRANFTQTSGGTYTLTVTRSPTAGGTTTPASSQANVNGGTPVNISATPASNYSFANWTVTSGTATFANANSAATTVTLSSNATIQANFNTQGGGNRRDTTKIEAEAYASKVGDEMRTETENGVTCIGYIQSGYSTTYNVNVSRAGAYTMEFRIALNQADVSSTSFTVSVNGQNAGTISSNGTGGWSTYQIVRLSSDVQLRQGSNTIVLNFGGPINVDYILLLGEGGTPVRFTAPNAKVRAGITLTAAPRGFTAALPTNHGYTSYRLIDLQGREVRSGKLGSDVSSLKFQNLKNSVLLLRLEGKNTSTVVKAVTY